MALYNIPIHLYIKLREVLIGKASLTYWKLESGWREVCGSDYY
jgi:hypothetical protein